VLRVAATFTSSGTDELAIDGPPGHVASLEVDEGAGFFALPSNGGPMRAASCRRHCDVRYTVDLAALAAACDDAVDCAARAGNATLSPALAWLLHPEPNGDADVTVRIRASDPGELLTGLSAAPGSDSTYRFRSPDLDEGAFTAFGPMRKAHLEVRGASVDLALLGGPLAMPDAEVAQWIERAALAASSLYDRFPVGHASIFVLSVPGEDEVTFGKVLALSGASVALLVGDRMTARGANADWVAVHELFHLGFPTFRGEGRWLEEGLATYYAPILRHRAGWTTEAELWAELAEKLPRGLPASPDEPLLYRRDLEATYWGGAIFALRADVALRRTGRGVGLDDGLRAVAAKGGNATRVWTVVDVLRTFDEATHTSVLRQAYSRQVVHDEPFDLEDLLHQLGVDRGPSPGRVTLHEDRPLAAIRRAISGG
jgi:hypothetical protein